MHVHCMYMYKGPTIVQRSLYTGVGQILSTRRFCLPGQYLLADYAPTLARPPPPPPPPPPPFPEK